MAAPTDAQIGYAVESSYGTYTAPTVFLPYLSDSLNMSRNSLESAAVLAGRRVLAAGQRNGGKIAVDGDTQHELHQDAMGTLFRLFFGKKTTTGAGPYSHVFDPDELTESATIQIGRPHATGVQAFTYLGCIPVSWQIACAADQIATVGVTWQGRELVTTESLASPSYSADSIKPLKFVHAAVEVASTATEVTGLTLSGATPLQDKVVLGDAHRKKPRETGRTEYTGTLDCQFDSMVHWTRFVAGTPVAFEVEFAAGANKVTIEGTVSYDGAPISQSSTAIPTQSIPIKFVASGATDDTAIKATIVDSTAAV